MERKKKKKIERRKKERSRLEKRGREKIYFIIERSERNLIKNYYC